jgi:predicted nucleic-acid-binding protein
LTDSEKIYEFIETLAKDKQLPKDVDDLSSEYVKSGVLKEKQIADCYHIAYAVAHGCDVIVSWNFEHIVNDMTKGRVKIVNATNRYKEIGIVSPDLLLKGVWR